MRFTGVLDRICELREGASLNLVMDCVRRLSALEGQMHEWMRKLYSELTGSPYWITSGEGFAQSLGFLEGDTYPRNMYDFPSLDVANQHIIYWLSLLALRQAQYDIVNSVSSSQYPFPITKSLRKRMISDIGESADNLVMSLGYVTKPSSGYKGLHCALAPVQMAFLWYKRRNDQALQIFCQRIAEFIETSGIRCSWSEW